MHHNKPKLIITDKRIRASSQFHELIGCRFKVLPRLLYVIGSSHGGEEESYENYMPLFVEKKFEIYFEPTRNFDLECMTAEKIPTLPF